MLDTQFSGYIDTEEVTLDSLRTYSPAALLVSGTLFTPFVFAQEVCEYDPPRPDVNNDGYADEFVSPDAIIKNSDIDCSFHNIQAGARIIDSTIRAEATIEGGAINQERK